MKDFVNFLSQLQFNHWIMLFTLLSIVFYLIKITLIWIFGINEIVKLLKLVLKSHNLLHDEINITNKLLQQSLLKDNNYEPKIKS